MMTAKGQSGLSIKNETHMQILVINSAERK